jgi:hypothetical protein
MHCPAARGAQARIVSTGGKAGASARGGGGGADGWRGDDDDELDGPPPVVPWRSAVPLRSASAGGARRRVVAGGARLDTTASDWVAAHVLDVGTGGLTREAVDALWCLYDWADEDADGVLSAGEARWLGGRCGPGGELHSLKCVHVCMYACMSVCVCVCMWPVPRLCRCARWRCSCGPPHSEPRERS